MIFYTYYILGEEKAFGRDKRCKYRSYSVSEIMVQSNLMDFGSELLNYCFTWDSVTMYINIHVECKTECLIKFQP